MSSKSTFSSSTSKSYAIALYELSKENSELNKVEGDVKSLNQLLSESPNFKERTFIKERKKTSSFFSTYIFNYFWKKRVFNYEICNEY